MKAMFRVIVVGALIAVAGCAKHEPPPEAARPVVAGSGARPRYSQAVKPPSSRSLRSASRARSWPGWPIPARG
jgi:hypothetical protein